MRLTHPTNRCWAGPRAATHNGYRAFFLAMTCYAWHGLRWIVLGRGADHQASDHAKPDYPHPNPACPLKALSPARCMAPDRAYVRWYCPAVCPGPCVALGKEGRRQVVGVQQMQFGIALQGQPIGRGDDSAVEFVALLLRGRRVDR